MAPDDYSYIGDVPNSEHSNNLDTNIGVVCG